MGFRIEISGLDKVAEKLSSKELNKILIPAINESLLKVHSFLKTEVNSQYTFSHRGRTLNKVLEGKSTNSAKQVSAIAIEGGLEYRQEPIKLVDFPFRVINVGARSSFYYRMSKDKDFASHEVDQAQAVQVRVKRGSGYKTVVGKKGFGGFYKKADRSGWDKYTLLKKPRNEYSNIYERLTNKNWDISPPSAVKRGLDMAKRAPVQVLFGPSLAQAAKTVYNQPSVLRRIEKEVADEISRYLDLKL